jgi:two-component system cell cycle sensor histidine kinase PleC
MRSAETSGVGVKGFGTSNRTASLFRELVRRAAEPFVRFAEGLSPVSLAIGLTALAAAAVSVGADATLTMLDAQARQREMMHVATAEPVAMWRYSGTRMTTLAGPAEGGEAFLGVMHRGAGAFAVALGVAAFAVRRRKPGPPAGGAYDGLLATIPFGVACWTADGRLVACNEQYRARLDAGDHDLRPGTSYSASVKRLIQGGYMQLISEDDHNRLLELHREDGSCLVIDERPLADGGFVTLVTDVTERRRTDDLLTTIREEQRQLARRYHEEKLKAEAASRAKTTFLAHLSHDIRTPLNHIIGFADMMRQQTYGPLGDRRYLTYVHDMKESGERLLQFFGSILELAELEGGQKPLRAEPFDVDDMLSTVTRRFSGQAQRAGISLAIGAPCGTQLVGDRFALERMTGNIVENAVRFTPAGGRVSVAAFAAADGVVLEITDTGIGMPAERLEALSQPFAFGDAALTRQHSGAGLGIAIARAIAELSGGRLAIDSRPALGTTVAISLPLPAANAAIQAA